MSASNRRFIQMLDTLEHIISLFSEFPLGLTTAELYELMQQRYGYTQTQKNLKNTYLSLLEDGAIKGVSFEFINRGKHKLKDSRFDGALEREKKIYVKLALESLEDLQDISNCHNDVCSRLHLDELEVPFFIKSESYQELNTSEYEIKLLEDAILQDNIIVFDYKNHPYHVAPLRMVSFDGIWYLYGKDIEEKTTNAYKTWLLKYIDNVEIMYDKKHDIDDDEVEEDLDNAYDAMFVPDKQITIELKASTQIAELFELKEYFPRQKILKRTDKSIYIQSIISTYQEILPEIKSLIPHIEIVNPQELKDMLDNDIKAFLGK